MEKFTVSRDDSIYEAWPDLVLTKGGRLICVFTECAHHKKRERVRLVLTYSDDRGRTWSVKKPLTEVCEGDFTWNCARIVRLRDDSLMIVCDLTAKDSDGTVYIWRGDAEGESFEGPIETPVKGIVPDKPLELSNGRIIFTTHRKTNPDTEKLRVYCRYTDDGCKSWSEEILIAADDRYNLCEANLIELKNGEIVAFLRENSFMGIDGQKAISRDQGLSWEGVYATALPCCHRPVATHLKSGNILITFRLAHCGGSGWGTWQNNFFAALTDGEGCAAVSRREQNIRLMPIDYDRSRMADLGYSGVVQFPDGEIYIVNYIMDDSPNSQIRGYSLRESDFILEDTTNA